MQISRVSYSDKDILTEIKSSSESDKNRAFTYLYKKHYDSFCNFVRLNNGTEEEAKDIFQEGLIIFYKKTREKEFTVEYPSTFFYSICKNLWMDKNRQKTNREKILQGLPEFSIGHYNFEDGDQQEKDETLLELVYQLGEDCRKVLLKFYYDLKSIKEITEEMGISSEAVAKNKKRHCMKKLKEIIVNNKGYLEALK